MTAAATPDRGASPLEAALAYAARGWRVFPIEPGEKRPLGLAVPHGRDDATTDEARIRAWWTRWPSAGVGIATGRESGLVVVDVDPRHEGDESLADMESRYGTLPESPTVQTGGGGTHIYLAHPGERDVRCRTHLAGFRGVDLKGDGGYVVAPPSGHPSGSTYSWNLMLHLEDVALAPAPAWLLDLAEQGPSGERVAYEPRGEADAPPEWIDAVLAADANIRRRYARDAAGLTDASPSGVDLSLTTLATCRGLTGEQAETLGRSARARAGLPPKPDSYWRATIGKALAAARARDERRERKAEPPTDTGNAERLVRQHGGDLRYVHTWGKWLAWDGRRFAIDASGEIERRAKETVRAIYDEAAAIEDAEERKRLASWATKSESAARREAMIQLARSEPPIPVAHDDLDADPWLLVVRNGALDLTSGELHPHDRADLATKLARVVYEPTASAPTWAAFLERILPDAKVRAFVQRAIGYSLTGDTREQVLFLLWGTGANGKSTFVETILALLGDYALRTPAETLLARREGAIPNDVAALRGARFVAAVESEEGRRLAEVRVKELTGGDTIAARFMRAEWFTFRPVAKLWLATNHRPQVRGTDEAIWRRIRLIPFTVTIPESERDKTLPERLRDELPGILAWAVRGCLDWQRLGLRPPPAVHVATSIYRNEQDVLGAFLEERCVLAPRCFVASAALYQTYRAWAETAGEQAMTQRALGLALRERGFEDDREGKERTRGWRGIGLLDLRHDLEGGHKADATT